MAAVVISTLVSGGVLVYMTRPNYGWLTFGREERVRLLLCDRGLWISATTYVDGNQLGSVKRVADWDDLQGTTLADPDGETTYRLASVTNLKTNDQPRELMVTVEVAGPVAYRQYCDVMVVADRPDSARVSQFHGPLTVGPVTTNWKLPDDLALERGSHPTTLRSVVGTLDQLRGCWVVVESHNKNREPHFPSGVLPEVHVEFPPLSAGQPPVERRYPLDQVCCGCVFYADIPVPDEAGEGTARVTYLFPTWADGHVESSTIELPIVPATADAVADASSE